MNGLNEAILLAIEAHASQVDKNGVAYILHPIRTMVAVRDEGEAAMAVAVLHDTIEDTYVSLDLLAGFSQEVIDGVDAMTRRDGEKYNDYVERLLHNPIARVVKLADCRDNLSRPFPGGEGLEKRYLKTIGRILWFNAELDL